MITRVLVRGTRRQKRRVRRRTREDRSRVRGRCFVAGFEDGGRSHWSGDAGSLCKLEKARKRLLP